MALSVTHARPAPREAADQLWASRAPVLAICVLTVLAFALRVVGVDQTLYGDEYFTHAIVTENGLGGVWEQVYQTSITPPLHYVLAWFAVQLGGDDTVLVRLPSLMLGTATVPLIFLLGRRIAGVVAGLLAAALIALSPFAIWYSDEARAYATMMFLVALSTLALLRAADGGERRWWIVYAVSACAALWSHYTAVFVIVAQTGWALWTHRDRARQLLFASAAIVLGYVAWVPGFLEQRQNDVGIEIIGAFARLTVGRVFELPLGTLVGHPFLTLADSPGAKGLLLALILALLVVAAAVRRPGLRWRPFPGLRSEAALMLMLALATPLGLLLYDAVSSSLYLPRNLGASVPALCVLVGVLLERLRTAIGAPLATIGVVAFVGVLGLIAVDTVLSDDQRRPAYREAAHYLDAVADPRDPVVDTPLTPANEERFRKTTLDLYFERSHPLYPAGLTAGGAWRQLRRDRSVYLVASEKLAPRQFIHSLLGDDSPAPSGMIERLQRIGGPDGRALLREERVLPGIFRISVFRFAGMVDGRLERRGSREIISWTFGRRVVVSPGIARGAVNTITPSPQPLSIGGWSLDAARPRPADWVLVFSGRRLLAVSAGGVLRPEIARVYGRSALLSGFALSPDDAPSDRSSIRVFAVVGARASELPFTAKARRAHR
jgi:4-amino-4-deoxy-L-arabinose transferase-like glycosyltransferase